MYSYQQRIIAPEATILVVDDIPDNCWMLQTLLEMEGYVVKIAEDGYEALDIVESQPPSLILLDMMMPGINGLEVAKRIKQNKRLPYIPIFLVTAWDNVSQANYTGTIDGLIPKPIDFEQLFTKVKAIVPLDTERYAQAA
jgi:CheY-like chemotaxis protein